MIDIERYQEIGISFMGHYRYEWVKCTSVNSL